MGSDVAAIEKVLQVYFDGLYEGDTKKLGEAFHPASHLYSAGPSPLPRHRLSKGKGLAYQNAIRNSGMLCA